MQLNHLFPDRMLSPKHPVNKSLPSLGSEDGKEVIPEPVAMGKAGEP